MTEKVRPPAQPPKPGEPVPELLPDKLTLPAVRAVAAGCKACDLYRRGTQTVFGEGPARAVIMMVGEQPGKAFKVSQQRGEVVASPLAPIVTSTVHPSSILRARDDDQASRDGAVRG